jgi:hypothetical protein
LTFCRIFDNLCGWLWTLARRCRRTNDFAVIFLKWFLVAEAEISFGLRWRRLGPRAGHNEQMRIAPMKQSVGLRCTICNHPARPQIDLAIATGLSKRAVAERFGVSRDAVWRHAQAHLTAEMRAALATKLLQREGDTRRILFEEGAGVTEALKAIRARPRQ